MLLTKTYKVKISKALPLRQGYEEGQNLFKKMMKL